MSRTEFTKRTMRDAYERSEGLCEGLKSDGERCCTDLTHRKKHFDHVIPDAIGGDNTLANCQVLCVPCHDEKTRKRDMPVIAKAKRNWDKHNGIPSRGPKIRSRGFAKSAPQRTASRPVRKLSFLGNQ